jgi:hypothetical protein
MSIAPKAASASFAARSGAVGRRHVGRDGHAAAALGFDRLLDLREPVPVAAHGGNVGAGIGEDLARLHPDSLGGASDQRGLAVEREALDPVGHGRSSYFPRIFRSTVAKAFW